MDRAELFGITWRLDMLNLSKMDLLKLYASSQQQNRILVAMVEKMVADFPVEYQKVFNKTKEGSNIV